MSNYREPSDKAEVEAQVEAAEVAAQHNQDAEVEVGVLAISAKAYQNYREQVPATYAAVRALLGQVQSAARTKDTGIVQTIRKNNWANFLNYLPDVKTFTYQQRLVVPAPTTARETELVLLMESLAGALAVLEVVEFWRSMYTKTWENYQQALGYLVVPAQIELFALIELHCKPAPFDHFQGCRRNFFAGGTLVAVSRMTLEVLRERLHYTDDEQLWATVRYWHTHGMLADIAKYLTLAGHCPAIGTSSPVLTNKE